MTRKVLFATPPLQLVAGTMKISDNDGSNNADDIKIPEKPTNANAIEEDPDMIDELPPMDGLSKDDRISLLIMELKGRNLKLIQSLLKQK